MSYPKREAKTIIEDEDLLEKTNLDGTPFSPDILGKIQRQYPEPTPENLALFEAHFEKLFRMEKKKPERPRFCVNCLDSVKNKEKLDLCKTCLKVLGVQGIKSLANYVNEKSEAEAHDPVDYKSLIKDDEEVVCAVLRIYNNLKGVWTAVCEEENEGAWCPVERAAYCKVDADNRLRVHAQFAYDKVHLHPGNQHLRTGLCQRCLMNRASHRELCHQCYKPFAAGNNVCNWCLRPIPAGHTIRGERICKPCSEDPIKLMKGPKWDHFRKNETEARTRKRPARKIPQKNFSVSYTVSPIPQVGNLLIDQLRPHNPDTARLRAKRYQERVAKLENTTDD